MKKKEQEQPIAEQPIEAPEASAVPPPITMPLKAPGKPPKPFAPGIDPVPVPFTVIQHPLYSDPEAAKPI